MIQDNAQLTKKSISAGSWLAGYRFLARLLNLIKTPIIARILTPAQFGVFGVVSIALNLFETFSETGLEQALIQKSELKQTHVSTAWLITLVRSLVISLGLWLSAPLVAQFFGLSEATLMIQVIAITPVLRALRNPSMIYYKKRLDFKRETVMLGLGSLTEVVLAIALTIRLENEWALVWAIVGGAVAELVSSYILFALPSWAGMDWSEGRKLIKFGGWIWSSSVLSYLANQGDDIIVGRILGAAPLGLYQNAYKIASLPATQISGTITQVTFPAFAAIQDDQVRLKRAFYKSLWFTLITTVPVSMVIMVAAHPLTLLIFGENWLELAPALSVLGLYGIIRSILGVLGPLAVAKGKPELITYSGLVRTCALFILIYPLTNSYGIVGAAWATVISIFVSLVALTFKLRRIFTNN